jgi:hypothetical protein
MTATRLAVLVAVVASASSVYLALGSGTVQAAQAALAAQWVTDAGGCAATAGQHVAK